MESLAEIASAIQGETHTEETIKWTQQLHDVEMHFTDELHKRELAADTRRFDELRNLENKLLARKLQVELDIGRRDATRDSVLLRASSVGNLLVALSVLIGCAFMFVYQLQLPATLPESPENYTFSVSGVEISQSVADELGISLQNLSSFLSSTSSNSSFLTESYSNYQLQQYKNHVKYAKKYGGGQLSILLHTIFLWTAIGVLASGVWIGLVLHLRIKNFKVHLPLFVYDCGHIHGVFGSYYSCRCLDLEVALRRLFLTGTVLIVLTSCVSSYEISVVSFASFGAALCFLVPVLLAILVVILGSWFVSEETAMVVPNSSRSRQNKYYRSGSSSSKKRSSSSTNNKKRKNMGAAMAMKRKQLANGENENSNNPHIFVSSPSHHNHHGNQNEENYQQQQYYMEPIDGNATNANSSPRSRVPSPLLKKRRKSSFAMMMNRDRSASPKRNNNNKMMRRSAAASPNNNTNMMHRSPSFPRQ